MISAVTGIVLLISGFSGGILVGLVLGALLMWLLVCYWLETTKFKP